MFKKLTVTTMMAVTLLAFASPAFAANMVSEMATKDGKLVAACAKAMDRGVSACAAHDGCK
ncbi:MAG: hypothetical protein ACOY9Y_11560 [Bacillota bacterium]